MKKAKFWMLQIAMVAIVGLVMGGSPVLADHNFDDNAWHDKWQVKKDKKEDKHKAKLEKIRAKYDGDKLMKKETKELEKFSKWEAKHEAKKEKHNAKYHVDATVSDPVLTCADFDLIGTYPNCF